MSGAGTSTLHERGVLQGHKGSVNVARFNRDGKYCLTGGDDRRVILWNPYKDPGEEIVPIKEYAIHSKQVLDVAVADDNASFASCGGDRTVFLWDVRPFEYNAVVHKVENTVSLRCVRPAFDEVWHQGCDLTRWVN